MTYKNLNRALFFVVMPMLFFFCSDQQVFSQNPTCEDCAGRKYYYLGCKGGTVDRHCTDNPLGDPSFQHLRKCQPSLDDFYTDLSSAFEWRSLDINTEGDNGENSFTITDLTVVAESAFQDWLDICDASGVTDDCIDCPPFPIRFSRNEEDMGRFPDAIAIMNKEWKEKLSGYQCGEYLCESTKLVVNATSGFLKASPEEYELEDERIRTFYYTKRGAPRPYKENWYDLESILLHELGHWFGFNHPGTPDVNGEPCNEDADDISESAMGTPLSSEQEIGLTEHDKCMYMKLYCCDAPTSVEEEYIEPVGFSVAPNPASDILTITLTKDIHALGYSARLVDINGRNVLQTELQAFSSWQIDVSSVPVGVYVLEVRHENGGNHSMKVVIKR